MNNLYMIDNYTSDITHLINSDIKYYDISKANISILYDKGVLNEDQYNRLYKLPKLQREIEVGLLMRDNTEIKDILKNGFIEYRRLLFEENNIEYDSVLSIKKDAVYVINRTLHNTKFNTVEFKLGGTYTSFYRVADLEIYYNSNFNYMDVKGINDNILHLHDSYFKEILTLIFAKAERQPLSETCADVSYIIKLYTEFKLDKECYREFNRSSSFRFNTKYNVLSDANYAIGIKNLSDELSNNFAEYVDISYNYYILMQLYNYYFQDHMNNPAR